MKKLIIIVFILTSTLSAQLTPVCFTLASMPNVGSNPNAVTTADFNNDGRVDIAVANNNSNNVSILLGLGTGSFATALNFSVGVNPTSITSGDFNNDGKADLATANNGTNTISVLLGTGTGSFITTTYSLGGYPTLITCGDFNGDSNKDLVLFTIGNGGFILLGSGTGTFSVASNFNAGINPTSLITGDFNNDSKIDIASGKSYPGGAFVVLGSGNGSFPMSSYSYYDLGAGVMSKIASGDFNSDGNIDLVTANQGSNDISVFMGSATGTFSQTSNGNIGPPIAVINTGDFNNDGKIDIAVSKYNGLGIILGYGNGLFDYNTVYYYTSGAGANTIANADFNNDGKLDLVSVNGLNNISILINSDNGTYPTINITTTNTLICSGQSATLNAVGTVSYLWDTGSTTNSIVINPSATNNYMAIGTSSNGCKVSATITQSVSACAGINVVNTNFSNLNVYPNPSNSLINVEFLVFNNELYKIEILNSLVQVLQTTNLQQPKTQLNIKELPSGIYQLKISEGSTQKVIKFIKN